MHIKPIKTKSDYVAALRRLEEVRNSEQEEKTHH